MDGRGIQYFIEFSIRKNSKQVLFITNCEYKIFDCSRSIIIIIYNIIIILLNGIFDQMLAFAALIFYIQKQ